MRNLDAINPNGMRPSRFTSFSAGVSFVLALLGLPLAYGAAPNVDISNNPVCQFLLVILIGSIILAFVSLIFRWGWKIEYYGYSLLCIGSVSLLAVVPLLVAMVYGKLPVAAKVLILLFYILTHFIWCRKFATIYKEIFNVEVLRRVVYEEESDAVYYNQRGDLFLLRKHYKFSQMPPDLYFAIFIVLALMLTLVMEPVRIFTGLPFAHVFLLVAMLPVSWMSIGLAMRGFLICYYYPSRIKNITGKTVYVDLVTTHQPFNKKMLRSSSNKNAE